MDSKIKEMLEEFVCPGCVAGSNMECGAYKPYKPEEGANGCKSHVLGTVISGIGNVALGLPKGFNRPGPKQDYSRSRNQMTIRLWVEGTHPDWDYLNVPVWAFIRDGYLFVRTYMPRINDTAVDIVDKGTLKLVPNAINVEERYDEFD